MSGFVYIWRDKKYNKYYVGSHWGTEDDGYVCSSQNMRVNRKHRLNDFKRRILSRVTTNRDDLLKEEQRWIDMIKSEEFGHKYYNINAKVKTYLWWMNEEVKKQVCEKISQTLRGSFQSSEHIQNKVHSIKMNKKKKKCCKHGHEFTLKNTYNNKGKRFCRTCDRMRAPRPRSRIN